MSVSIKKQEIINKIKELHYQLHKCRYSDFVIFIWGPGSHSSYWSIRKNISNKLETRFESVFFSEELTLPIEPKQGWLDNLLYQEALHGQIADLIFILPLSIGSMLEFIIFSTAKGVRDKLYPIIIEEELGCKGLMEKVTSFLLQAYEGNNRIQKFKRNTPIERISDISLDIAMKEYRRSHPLGPQI